VRLNHRKKESYASTQPDLRAKIPHALSLAVALAIESQPPLISTPSNYQ